jgi:hypothetical protein
MRLLKHILPVRFPLIRMRHAIIMIMNMKKGMNATMNMDAAVMDAIKRKETFHEYSE